MNIRPYLPSGQFLTLIVSLLLSIGLVYGAGRLTKPQPPTTVASVPTPVVADTNWEATLYAIQAQNASSSLPKPPSEADVDSLRKAAQGPNLTDTVSRTLLVNLADAKAQGLGSDVPTQDQIVAAALGQIHSATQAPAAYTRQDLTVVENSPASMRAYGNDVMAVLAAHPQANLKQVLLAVGEATDNADPSRLAPLQPAAAAYAALAQDLSAVPVPQTLVPFHLEILNDLAQMSSTLPDIETIVTDPLRGLTGLQQFQSLANEAQRVFINIAQALSKGGILFSKDEPGASWASLLSSQN